MIFLGERGVVEFLVGEEVGSIVFFCRKGK